MNIEDLKTGMIIETRNGDRYIIIKNLKIDDISFLYNIAIDETGWLDLWSYDKLGRRYDKDTECFDIVKVYNPMNCNLIYSKTKDSLLKLIWEENEFPQLTDRERAYLKAYSYDYEWIARDNDGCLGFFKEKPIKITTAWYVDDMYNIDYLCKKDLFTFIKWEDEEPYKISDLLGE